MTMTVTPVGDARWQRVSEREVHLDAGTIAVTAQGPTGVRVAAADGEVDAEPGAVAFDIAARTDGGLHEVDVHAGRAKLIKGTQVILLAAGESWHEAEAVRTVQRETIVPKQEPADTKPEATSEKREPDRAKKRHAPSTRVAERETTHAEVSAGSGSGSAARTAPPAPEPARPGEEEFRAGWAALRAGDAAGAQRSFASACERARKDALGQDACFWVGAAAKRAGDASAARTALTQFLAQFPGSARAGEAAALLGWILYDAGELDGAATLFHQAEHDRVPQVRDSASRGLTAIARRAH
jgi:TolA-binding protein